MEPRQIRSGRPHAPVASPRSGECSATEPAREPGAGFAVTEAVRKYGWMSDEFFAFVLDLGSKFPRMPRISAVVQYHITDGPTGEASFFEDIRDGRMHRIASGHTDAFDAEITVTYSDFKKLLEEQRPSETLPNRQVSGDTSKLERLAELHKTPAYRALRENYVGRIAWPDESGG